MGAEKRRFPRYEEKISVHLKRAQFDFKLVSENVSREGVGLITDDPRALPRSQQEIVSLLVAIPDGQAPLRVVGQVAWSKQAERGIELGVRYYLIAREEKERWDKWIDEVGERERAKVALEARRKAEAAKKRGQEIIERQQKREQAEAAESAPPVPVEAPKPWVIAVDPAYDRSRRRFPRQRMLFLIRHHTPDSLKAFCADDFGGRPVPLTAPAGALQAGEMVNLVLVHPSTQAEFELLGKVVDLKESPDGRPSALEVVPELSDALRAEMTSFIATGKIAG